MSDVDPNDCLEPNDVIEYTITVDPNGYDHVGVTVRDLLPYGVSFVSADPNYNYIDFTDVGDCAMVWQLGDIDVTDPSVTITITGQINEMAEPLGTIKNTAYVESDVAYSWASVTDDVCCWGGDIIRVDASAQGVQTGVSWADAYVDLQDALARARAGCGNEIWVAGGVYVPGTSSGDNFELVDGVEMYGGFQGNETSRSERAGSATILSGNGACLHVITASNVDDTTILDGFTISDATSDGISCSNSDLAVSDCTISDHGGSGFYSNGGDPTLSGCSIYGNGDCGMECYGSSSLPTVGHCVISGNTNDGVYTDNAVLVLGNSFIKGNGGDGVHLNAPAQMPSVYNVTANNNGAKGVYQAGGTTADVFNVILWGNNSDAVQFSGCDLSTSCYYDPNDPQGSSTPDVDGNITCDPCFVYDNPANGHLRGTSACVDLGYNYSGSATDTDLDGNVRVFDGDNDFIDEIDMGCDEVDCTEVEHAWDFNEDGIINMAEFRVFAAAWGKDSTDPNWADPYSECDFYADNVVDVLDLAEFADVWLWQACWMDSGTFGMMMAMGGMDGGAMMAMPIGGDLLIATATAESAAVESVPVTAVADDQLDALRYARWYELSGPFEPTLQMRIMELEQIVFWLESVPAEYPDIWDEIDQGTWYDFIDDLKDQLQELWFAYVQEEQVQQ